MRKSKLYQQCEQVWDLLKVEVVQNAGSHGGGENQSRQANGPTHIGYHPQSGRQVMALHDYPAEPGKGRFILRITNRGTINVFADPDRRKVVSGATPARIEAFLASLTKSL